MDTKKNKRIILQKVQTYITILKENNIKLKKYIFMALMKKANTIKTAILI